VPSLTIATCTLWLAAAQTLMLSLVFSPPPVTVLQPSTLLAVVWLGIFGSTLGYVLYFFIMAHWGASRTTLVTFVLPIVGLTLGAIFLQEILDWRIVVGSALVILGVVLASLINRPVVARERASEEIETPTEGILSAPGGSTHTPVE
jgi:drug/metabolite transporter (DMT)-like permease